MQAAESEADPNTATLWWAGKELLRGNKLSQHVGKNEKTKVRGDATLVDKSLLCSAVGGILLPGHVDVRFLPGCRWFPLLKIASSSAMMRRSAPPESFQLVLVTCLSFVLLQAPHLGSCSHDRVPPKRASAFCWLATEPPHSFQKSAFVNSQVVAKLQKKGVGPPSREPVSLHLCAGPARSSIVASDPPLGCGQLASHFLVRSFVLRHSLFPIAVHGYHCIFRVLHLSRSLEAMRRSCHAPPSFSRHSTVRQSRSLRCPAANK